MNHSVSGSEAHRRKPLPPPLPPRALMSPPVCKYANEHHTHWARAAGRGRRCPRAGGLGAEPLPRGGAAPPLPRDGPAPGLARHGTAETEELRQPAPVCADPSAPSPRAWLPLPTRICPSAALFPAALCLAGPARTARMRPRCSPLGPPCLWRPSSAAPQIRSSFSPMLLHQEPIANCIFSSVPARSFLLFP